MFYRIAVFCLIALFSFLSGAAGSFVTHELQLGMESGFSYDSLRAVSIKHLEKALEYQYNNVDSALWYTEKAALINEQLQNDTLNADVLFRFGAIYYVKGEYDTSLNYFVNSLQLNRKLNRLLGIGDNLNGLGLISLGQHNFKEALNYYFQSQAIFAELADSVKLARNYFNIGLCYDELSQYDSAHYFLKKSLILSEKYEKWQFFVMGLGRTAETHFHQGNYDSAIYYYDRVINLKHYKSNWDLAFSYSGKAQTYLKMSNGQLAVANAQKSLNIAREMNALWDAKRAAGILADAYALTQNYSAAFETHKLFKQLSDSLYNESKVREINALKVKQKQIENEQLIAEKAFITAREKRIRTLNFLYIILLLVFSIFSFFLVRSIKIRHRLNRALNEKNKDNEHKNELIQSQNNQLNAINKSKDKLFSIISHDLRGPISSIQQAMELSKEEFISKEEVDEMMNAMYASVSKTSIMLNNLLHWAKSQMEGIKVKPEKINLVNEVNELIPIFNIKVLNKNISLCHQSNDKQALLIKADIEHVRIIIQNILGNATKFTHEGGKIEIFYSETTEYVMMHIKDNGVGMTKEQLEALFYTHNFNSERGTNNEEGTGLGLILVNQLLLNNGGLLDAKSAKGEGAEFIITFPKWKD